MTILTQAPGSESALAAEYDAYAARYDGLDGGAAADAAGFTALRGRLLAGARGDVLEVACGTGLNFGYYALAGQRCARGTCAHAHIACAHTRTHASTPTRDRAHTHTHEDTTANACTHTRAHAIALAQPHAHTYTPAPAHTLALAAAVPMVTRAPCAA